MDVPRRDFLRTTSFTVAAFTIPGLFAEWVSAQDLIQTPAMTEGPFYPDKLPLDTDNDLLIINDSLTPAVGQITHLSGRILDAQGNPLRNAFVEIWQCDNNGVYLHSRSDNANNRDANFQGYGRYLTDSTGRYYFRTIKPVPYPGRTPHIHFGISRHGRRIFTTQMLVHGEPQNATDGLFRQIRDPLQREAIQAEFKPVPMSPFNELAVEFDVVLGLTPDERALQEQIRGVGKPLGGGRQRGGPGSPGPRGDAPGQRPRSQQ